MKQQLLAAALGCLLTLSFGPALADSDDHDHHRRPHEDRHHNKPYVIKHRIADQERAIHDGLRNGSLTKREAHTLRHNVAQIKNTYRHAKNNDDHISMREREHLDHMLDRNDRMIRKLETNGITRF